MNGIRMIIAKCCIVELAKARKSIASLSGDDTLMVSEDIFCLPWLILLRVTAEGSLPPSRRCCDPKDESLCWLRTSSVSF